MPRFVILEHDHPYLHWDFMLECGGALRTWRLAAPPRADEAVDVTPLGDHRLAYLNYEGPLSDNRGCVYRWDAGTFEVVRWEDDEIEVIVRGARVNGTIAIDGFHLWFRADGANRK
jgi:hypothetical protein